MFAQTRDDVEDPGRDELFEVGCAAQILALHRETSPDVWIVMRALQSVRLEGFSSEGAYTAARVAPFEVRSRLFGGTSPGVPVHGARLVT